MDVIGDVRQGSRNFALVTQHLQLAILNSDADLGLNGAVINKPLERRSGEPSAELRGDSATLLQEVERLYAKV